MTEIEQTEALATVARIIYPLVAGVIERHNAWEELGLSYEECEELYRILKPCTAANS